MVYRILKNNCIHNTATVNKTKIVKGRTNEKNISLMHQNKYVRW